LGTIRQWTRVGEGRQDNTFKGGFAYAFGGENPKRASEKCFGGLFVVRKTPQQDMVEAPYWNTVWGGRGCRDQASEEKGREGDFYQKICHTGRAGFAGKREREKRLKGVHGGEGGIVTEKLSASAHPRGQKLGPGKNAPGKREGNGLLNAYLVHGGNK